MGQVDLGAAGGEGRSCLLVISLGESRSPARSTVALLWIKRPCISFSYFVYAFHPKIRYVVNEQVEARVSCSGMPADIGL